MNNEEVLRKNRNHKETAADNQKEAIAISGTQRILEEFNTHEIH